MRIEEPAVDTANDADVAEQRAELDETPFDDTAPADAASDDPVRGGRLPRDLPLEANPADVAEQDADALFDDEER